MLRGWLCGTSSSEVASQRSQSLSNEILLFRGDKANKPSIFSYAVARSARYVSHIVTDIA